MMVLKSILDRLIYNDIYPVIDSNLSDANVGARKGKNVRDNLFVLYAIIDSIKKGGEEACDVSVYDVENALILCGIKNVSMISGMLGVRMTKCTY